MTAQVQTKLGPRQRRSRGETTATFVLESAGQARALFHPLRIELLQLLAEPHSCGELAAALGSTPQRVHYHVKALEAAGLLMRVGERRVRALTESIYQAAGRHFWPGAKLLAELGGPAAAQAALSRDYLLALAEELGRDAAQLALARKAEAADAPPTLSLSAQVCLADPKRRSAFLQELQAAIQRLAEKYGSAEGSAPGETYKLLLACYQNEPDSGSRQQQG